MVALALGGKSRSVRAMKLLSQLPESHAFAWPTNLEETERDLGFAFLQYPASELFACGLGRLKPLDSLHRVADPPKSGSLPAVQSHWRSSHLSEPSAAGIILLAESQRVAGRICRSLNLFRAVPVSSKQGAALWVYAPED